MAPRPYRARDSVTRTRTRSPGTAPRTNITYPSSLPTPSPPNPRPSIVGPDVARRARASAMSGGTLEILVDNSPWLHELTLRSDDLLRRVRERFPEISAVKFALSTAPVAPSSRERTGVPRPERTA